MVVVAEQCTIFNGRLDKELKSFYCLRLED